MILLGLGGWRGAQMTRNKLFFFMFCFPIIIFTLLLIFSLADLKLLALLKDLLKMFNFFVVSSKEGLEIIIIYYYRILKLKMITWAKSGESEGIGILPGGDSVWFSGHNGTGKVEDMENDMLLSLNETNTIFFSWLQPMDLPATDHYQNPF
jgi:hypothetical protein